MPTDNDLRESHKLWLEAARRVRRLAQLDELVRYNAVTLRDVLRIAGVAANCESRDPSDTHAYWQIMAEAVRDLAASYERLIAIPTEQLQAMATLLDEAAN